MMYTTLNRTSRQWHHKKCGSGFWRYYCGTVCKHQVHWKLCRNAQSLTNRVRSEHEVVFPLMLQEQVAGGITVLNAVSK